MGNGFFKIKGEKIIIAALMMILAAELGRAIWPLPEADFEIANAIKNYLEQKSSPMNNLVNVFSLCGYFILCISLITIGIRQIREKITVIKGLTLTLVGLTICAYHIVMIQNSLSIGKTLNEIKRPNYEMIKLKSQQANLPLKTRSMLSRSYALDKYIHEGKIVEYVSESGVSKAFEPTAKEKTYRNVQANSREIWEYNNRILPRVLGWWIAATIISVALGVVTPIRKVAPNMRSDHDRA